MLFNNLSVIVLILSSFTFSAYSQDTSTTSSFFNKKRVVATYNINNILGDEYSGLQAYKYDYTLGKKSKSYKNKYKTSVSETSLQVNLLQLRDAIEVELRSAQMYGIDVFKIKYNIWGDAKYKSSFKEVLVLTLKVAEEKNIDFNFCLDVYFPKNKDDKYTKEILFSKLSNDLGEIYGSTNMSKKWLRNAQNKLVLFTSNTRNIATYFKSDVPKKFNKTDIKKISAFFEDLNLKNNLNTVPVYHVQPSSNKVYTEIINHFEAVTHSLNYLKDIEKYQSFKAKFVNKDIKFFPHLSLSYMSNEFIKKENNKKVKIGKKQPIDTTYLLNHNPSGTKKFRDLLDISLSSEIELMSLSSWNIYNLSTNINPEIHNGYALSSVLSYYINRWNGKKNPIEEEMTYVAFRNLNVDEMNHKEKFTVRNKNNNYEGESMIEVVTLLSSPAQVYFNNKYLGLAKEGFDNFYIKKETETTINVKIKREGKKVIDYTSPKTFTGHKYKFDPLMYITSSIDHKKSLELSDIILDLELTNMKVRFLLSAEGKAIWKEAAQEFFMINRKSILEHGDNPIKYLKMRDKNYEKFKLQVKKVLNEFEYNIWVDLENDRINEKGLEEEVEEEIGAMKGYNILD